MNWILLNISYYRESSSIGYQSKAKDEVTTVVDRGKTAR